MNETENISEWIERYQSNELNQQELARFLSLLEKNPLLRREVKLYKELDTILADEGLLELSEKLRQIRGKTRPGRNKWIPFLIAASVIFLLTVGIFTIIKSGLINNSGDQPVAAKSSAKNKNNYLSGNFIPIPEFEILIGSTLRGPTFKLQSPQSRTIISRGMDLIFEWTTVEVQNTVIIELFNNKGERVFKSLPFPWNRFTLTTAFFEPGIYYWKIIIDDELISIGRMTLL